MPITITPAGPTAIVGPGLALEVRTDFVGPMPSGTVWDVVVSADAEGTQQIATFSKVFVDPFDQLQWGTDFQFWTNSQFGEWGVTEGTTVHILATLTEPGDTVVDSGSTTAEYSGTAGIGALIKAQTAVGGFTSDDRAQLTTITDQMTIPVTTAVGSSNVALRDFFSQKTLDAITLAEISPGSTPDPVTADISDQWIFGVIVRITTIPVDLVGFTPDADWYLPDLAVLTIFRGTDKARRVPIHTSTHMEYPLPGYADAAVKEITLGTQPPWSSVEVDFRAGVEGRVFLMRFP